MDDEFQYMGLWSEIGGVADPTENANNDKKRLFSVRALPSSAGPSPTM